MSTATFSYDLHSTNSLLTEINALLPLAKLFPMVFLSRSRDWFTLTKLLPDWRTDAKIGKGEGNINLMGALSQ